MDKNQNIIVIGSGISGVTLCEELIKKKFTHVTLITNDVYGYYSRPLLSHGISQDVRSRIILKTFEALSETGIHVLIGHDVQRIDRQNKNVQVNDKQNNTNDLSYDTLILAPGSEAFIPPPFRSYRDYFFVLNSLDDLIQIQNQRQKQQKIKASLKWAIIGGGVIGCELASDVLKGGDHLFLYHIADRLMERQLSPEHSQIVKEHLASSGAKISLKQNVTGIEKTPDGYKLQLDQNLTPETFDFILLATGFHPRTQLAKECGLTVNRGIVTNSFFKTNDDNIYAIGDASEVNGELYAFIMPIRHQSVWLAKYLANEVTEGWMPPQFKMVTKIHGLKLN